MCLVGIVVESGSPVVIFGCRVLVSGCPMVVSGCPVMVLGKFLVWSESAENITWLSQSTVQVRSIVIKLGHLLVLGICLKKSMLLIINFYQSFMAALLWCLGGLWCLCGFWCMYVCCGQNLLG